MRILITGNRGFLGKNLEPVLSLKHKVVGYDLQDEEDIFDDVFELDLSTSDLVIHLAALTSVADSFTEPEKTFYTNVLGTSRVVDLCKRYNKRLIYPSSAAVFAPELSPYAKSKYLAEEIVKGLNSNTVVLRFVNMFGSHMNKRSGSMMYNFLNNDKIVVFGDGEQTRDFIHVRDVISIIEEVIDNEDWNGRVIDIGTGQPYSTNYVAGLFAHYRKKPISYEPPKREMRWHITDISLLKSLYTKKLTTNLEKDIKELCQAHLMSLDSLNKQ